VKDHLTMLRANMVQTKYHVLRQMIESAQAVPTAMNMGVAQGTYFRGMKLALAESERRYGGATVEDPGASGSPAACKKDPPKPFLPTTSPSVDRPYDPPKIDAPTVRQFIPMADFLQFAKRGPAECCRQSLE